MAEKEKPFRLLLKGKTAVFIDWANVHGWQKSLKQKVDLKKLFAYLKSYEEVENIRFYFGSDDNEGSKKFLKTIRDVGYSLVTKSVKYILVAEVKGEKVYKRKCDFDLEICIDVHELIEQDYKCFLFFTGDGDFDPLYRLLIRKKKQVIVIYAHGHLGREIYALERIFKMSVDGLGNNLLF